MRLMQVVTRDVDATRSTTSGGAVDHSDQPKPFESWNVAQPTEECTWPVSECQCCLHKQRSDRLKAHDF